MTKESGKKKPPAASSPSGLTREETPFPTKPRLQSANTRIGHQRNKSRTFTEYTNLFVVVVPVFFVLLTLPLLLFYPYSYSLSLSHLFFCYNPLLSPKYSFYPLLSTLSPFFVSSSYPSLTCHHITTPSYTFTTR
jgi:hypothetical protein